jgi:hypothetical protein
MKIQKKTHTSRKRDPAIQNASSTRKKRSKKASAMRKRSKKHQPNFPIVGDNVAPAETRPLFDYA